MHNALRARFEDTNTTVIETLYEAPQALLPIVSNKDFLTTLSKALSAEDLPRAVLRQHLNFLCNNFSTANPSLQVEIFTQVLFEHLIFTKSRQKSATAAWEIVQGSAISRHQVLKGTLEIVKSKDANARSVEDMVSVNKQVVDRIARKYY